MIPLWIPAVASFLTGIAYLLCSDARPPYKILVAALFGVAVYLQFYSRHALTGLLLQSGLAVYLAIWLRLTVSTARR